MPTIWGTNGAETINAADGVTNSDDIILALGGDDTIFGLGGNDMIKGGGGADAIDGGAGVDTAYYDDSNAGVTVFLNGQAGIGGTAQGDTLVNVENLSGSNLGDILVGDDGANTIWGLNGNDVLKGGGGADTLNGDDGNDTLKGGGGADALNGGVGNDTAAYNESASGVFVNLNSGLGSGGDAAGDVLDSIENLTGSTHNDTLWGDNNANVLKGLEGNDTLKGFGGADNLQGGDGTDTLYGMDGNDTLLGGNGNDTLIGGANVDTMTGGAGDDTFTFTSITDSGNGGATPDVITDFDDNADVINLSSIDANTTVAGNQAFVWIGNDNAWSDAFGVGQLRTWNGYLEGDVDGDHVADFRIKVEGTAQIHEYALVL